MISDEQIESLKELLTTIQSVLVIVDSGATLDQWASACSLFLGLQQTGKETTFCSPRQPRRYGDLLAGMDQLRVELGNQNLVISFDYNPEKVDKVSYHIGEETNRFYLTIKPKKGTSPLDSSNVEYSYTGAEADLIFLVGVHELTALEHLYFGFEGMYQDSTVVTLHNFAPVIGNINLDVSGSSSMSEAVVELMQGLGVEISEQMATNLLIGIEDVTENLSSLSATAETFEAVASLMRQGARRVKRDQEEEVVDSRQLRKKVAQSVFRAEKAHQVEVSRDTELDSPKKTRSLRQRKKTKISPKKLARKKHVAIEPKVGGLRHQPGGLRR